MNSITPSPREALVYLVTRAIMTGGAGQDSSFTMGRSTAFCDGAAGVAHLMYGADIEGATAFLRKHVGIARTELHDLKDDEKSSKEAHGIVTQMLDTQW